MNLPAVRQAMADLLTDNLGGVQVSPYMIANPTPPAAHLFPAPVDYDQAFARGMDQWTFTLQVYVAEMAGLSRGAQERLDDFISTDSTHSVKRALELTADGGPQTLGGLIDDLRVVSCDGYRRYAREGMGPLFGSEWTIDVRAEGV